MARNLDALVHPGIIKSFTLDEIGAAVADELAWDGGAAC